MCNYPFVFDAIAKTQLLMMDQNIQMQLAVQEAVQRVQFNPFAARDPARIQFLVLEVRRSHIAYDTMSALDQRPASDLKKPLKVGIVFTGTHFYEARTRTFSVSAKKHAMKFML